MLLAVFRVCSHAGALPAELWLQIVNMKVIAINLRQPKHYTSLPKVDKVPDTINEGEEVLAEEKAVGNYQTLLFSIGLD
ncbi:hypothetical protein [Prochlorococcus marinus]|uniref:hypothetical protein n=1 Tax=Prochlorococcus marinus TaxID=1219 RepID=UPI0022B355F7|nr:hypothetical protein [Prochlorococcus marinus]